MRMGPSRKAVEASIARNEPAFREQLAASDHRAQLLIAKASTDAIMRAIADGVDGGMAPQEIMYDVAIGLANGVSAAASSFGLQDDGEYPDRVAWLLHNIATISLRHPNADQTPPEDASEIDLRTLRTEGNA